jgi:tRNA U38,U39,U40 pseudouridine synthase TruA
MVRRIAGVLVEIGRGRLDRRSYQELLRTPAPARVAPFTAPPSGLFLERVVYDHKMPLGPVVPAVALQVREGITGR